MPGRTAGRSAEGRLPFKVRFFYGGVEGGTTVVWGVFSFFFLFFLTDVVGMNPATAGTVVLISGIWDAVTDPIAGIISDQTRSRWGRRRPYMIAFLLPFAASAWLLFTDFGLSPGWTVAYFIAANVLFYFVQDFIAVPGNSLAAEMTHDYNERTSLMSWRTVWSAVFTLVGMVAPMLLVETLTGVFGRERWGWSAMMATLALVGTIPILLAWNFTRGYERHPERPVRIAFGDLKEMLLKNRPFVNLVWIIIGINGSVGILTTSVIYFLEHHMRYTGDGISLAFLVFQVTGVLFVPVVNWVVQRHGKRVATMAGGALAVLVFGAYFLVFPGQDVLIYVLFVGSALASDFMYMTYWSMVPDVTEVDELKSGQRREAVYFSATDFINKVSKSLGAFLVGVLLNAAGYVPEAPPESAVVMIRVLTSFAPAALALLLVWFGYLNPMTREKHEALKKAIELKKAGKEYDAESIKGIV